MRIILAGGGTGGPAVPLIAIAQQIKKKQPKVNFLFVGTNKGPEKDLVNSAKIDFSSILSGKFRRYFSVMNIIDPFLVIIGFFQSLSVISKFNPDLIMSAGGYVSVPVILAGWIMRKKILIHQQDYVPSLTNKILAPFANKITVAFEKSTKDFFSGSGIMDSSQQSKAVWTGNPVREEMLGKYNESDVKQAKKELNINDELPVILILGGATGALGLNQIILKALPQLVEIGHVIHSVGSGKAVSFKHERYHQFAFVKNMLPAYLASDIVISRAGLSTITELSALSKPTIFVPMPNSHQEENAMYMAQKVSAIVLDQDALDSEKLISNIKKVIYDGTLQKELKTNIYNVMPKDSAQRIADIALNLCHTKRK